MQQVGTVGRIALIVLMLVANPCWGQVIFWDGFEYSDSPYNYGWYITSVGDPDSTYTQDVIVYSGDRALFMTSLDDDEQALKHDLGGTYTSILAEVWMFDDLDQPYGYNLFAIGQNPNLPHALIGYRSPVSQDYYSTEAGSLGSWQATSVPRTHGWHKLAFKIIPEGIEYYIDDVLVRFSGHMNEISYVQFFCGNHGYGPALGHVYFDDVEVRTAGAMVVALDIKPGSCPNPLNRKGGGVLPVAILGDPGVDVSQIDPSTIRLVGVAPLRHAVEDVGSPIGSKTRICDCIEGAPDLYDDLALKFDKKAVRDALGEFEPGEEILLTITGQLFDGTEIEGEDCVRINPN